jgi:UDP-N-acetylmuramate: L-alanyl-gamma-D-glutamyl-meso-diaminopimelate ligase
MNGSLESGRRLPLDVYCIAIGGTGMAPLAALLQERGHRVRGADGPLYPPMSTVLARAGIHPHVGYDPAHLAPRPDLVVVGNAVPRSNPEVAEVERLGLPKLSMPEALARFFLAGRRPLVVAGTHGKTTTTSLAAWVWRAAGADPGYLIGGLPIGFEASFAVGSGERFIVEGDEYNAAYFDRGPKFRHYRPEVLILTSAEYDHADLYPDPESLLAAYGELVAALPAAGLLVACGDWPSVRRLARRAPCPVVFYGLGDDNDVHPEGGVESGPAGSRWRLAGPGGEAVELVLALPGSHNVTNALGVWAAARHDALEPAAVARALATFPGVARRLEELGAAAGVTVVDDFAHHPTAVGESLAALAGRHPGRRLVAVYEPRSLTAGRRMFHDAYRRAFAAAGRVFLAPVFHRRRLGPDECLDVAALARDLAAAGVPATALGEGEDPLAALLAEVRRGDVVVTMSSGSFAGLPRRLLAALGGGAPPRSASTTVSGPFC